MKKILAIIALTVILIMAGYYTFIYYVPFSEGTRSGELIKFSNRGLFIKTWEGEISQGISGAQIFSFSVEQNNEQVISDLQKFQGKYVEVSYLERYGSFFWLGDTNHFITAVTLEKSPHSGAHRTTLSE
ncbi:MAG: 6-phosphogluconate dehydrogenase [Bizionia sp.]|nr:6-phosphogluconate dehydrogenase [Bizionia sp.]